MSMPYLVTDNLKQMGIDIDALPEICPCSCPLQSSPTIGYILRERARLWRIWCDCGQSTAERVGIRTAIEEWREINGQPNPRSESDAADQTL